MHSPTSKEFGKFTGYQSIIQKLIVFQYTSSSNEILKHNSIKKNKGIFVEIDRLILIFILYENAKDLEWWK